MMSLFSRDRIWPTIIVLVLLGNVTLGITLMRVAASDPHFAVEPDYYRRAVGWDTTQAQARENLALGWQVQPALGPIGSDGGTLTLILLDRDGVPLEGATVRIEARAVAHAAEVISAELVPATAPGAYVVTLPIVRTGLWELRVSAVRGVSKLATQVRLDARSDGPAAIVVDRPGAPDPARVAAGMRREP